MKCPLRDPFSRQNAIKCPLFTLNTHIHVEPFLFFRLCPSNILSPAVKKSVVIWCKARKKSLLRANPCWFNSMDRANSHWTHNCWDSANFWINRRSFLGITGCRTNGFCVPWNYWDLWTRGHQNTGKSPVSLQPIECHYILYVFYMP